MDDPFIIFAEVLKSSPGLRASIARFLDAYAELASAKAEALRQKNADARARRRRR